MDYIYEFEWIRDKLKKLAQLLTTQNQSDIIEASFIIGCLHSICHEHAEKIKKENKKPGGCMGD